MRCFQGAAQFIQFVVHEYPQSLESFCRGMEVTREPISSVVSYSCSYNGGQLPRGDNRTLISSLDDSSRNTNCKKKITAGQALVRSSCRIKCITARFRTQNKERLIAGYVTSYSISVSCIEQISCDLSRFASRRKVEKRFKK